jgi:hypothetical protein
MKVTAGSAVPWTRAERTREIGYAAAMFEISQAGREVREGPVGLGIQPPPYIADMAPELAYFVGMRTARVLLDRVIAYAQDAYLMHVDPSLFSRHVDRVAEGGYGTAPAEPGGPAAEGGTQ